MPQKERRPRTTEANSISGEGAPAAHTTTAPRRSLRLLSAANRGGAGPAAAAAATPRRRSLRLLSLVEDRRGGAATPHKTPPGLLSDGGIRGSLASPPGSRGRARSAARSLRRSAKMSSTRRSIGSSKSAADSGGETRPDATRGGDPEWDCRRRSARLRNSIGKGLMGEVENGNVSDELGRSLGRKRERKKKDVSVVPKISVAKSGGRTEVGSVVSEESGGDVSLYKGNTKRGMSVVPAAKGGRDRKRRPTMRTQEEVEEPASQRRGVESGSCCPRWTSEQEVALHRAYILAKPSPHFWKKVAKLVPGKSAQECFDRMHSKVVTPVPIQPRSRAKTKDCSPLGFSDLFKNNSKRSRSSKRESLLAHKTVRHILRKHSVMDQGQEADLFSVLETSPSIHADFRVSEYTTESPELLQRSNENLSSSHKKILSRFKFPIQANYASPEVLKPVKNIVLHEKYIDELHCREAKRRMCAKAACSLGSEDDKENAVPKGDVVKAAKNALASEAKGIICQFGHIQSSPSSNSEDSEDECEEDT